MDPNTTAVVNNTLELAQFTIGAMVVVIAIIVFGVIAWQFLVHALNARRPSKMTGKLKTPMGYQVEASAEAGPLNGTNPGETQKGGTEEPQQIAEDTEVSAILFKFEAAEAVS